MARRGQASKSGRYRDLAGAGHGRPVRESEVRAAIVLGRHLRQDLEIGNAGSPWTARRIARERPTRVMKAAAPGRRRAGTLVLAVSVLASSPHLASAYEAAGDRVFPALILLPQVAPADQIYLTPTTQPMSEGRSTDVALNFAKTLTERLGVRFEEDYTWLGRNFGSTQTGWQNLDI